MNPRTMPGAVRVVSFILVAVVASFALAQGQQRTVRPQSADLQQDRPEWALNMTAIEACSCPMFCPCYFNTSPASHSGHGEGEMHFCLFNMAWKVNSGHHGDTNLAGAKFWISGDLGDSWSDGEMEWAHVRFDPAVTEAQRKGILAALPHLFPAKWKSFTVGEDAAVEWSATKDRAVAKLAGGEAAEITLNRVPQSNTEEAVVIHNLKYWGAPRNDGFVLMTTEHHATKQTPDGVKPYEFKNSNGFMITVDINADDAAKAAAAREEATDQPAAGHGGGDGMGH